jgi:formylglycine-generating enzyme required for sulfatase activity
VPTPAIDPADFVDPKGIPMVLVPAGKFTMGSDRVDDERPIHDVYLDAFYIDRYEVTNSYYKTCVTEGVCEVPQDRNHYDNLGYANHPVVNVDWSMAKTFCEWRGARLPTEAEWEKAARGTDNRIYPWGNSISSEEANYDNYVKDTKDVGSYRQSVSPYGAYDMAGNVWEWVADWYSKDYYLYFGSNNSNPQGPPSGEDRVVRGGSWSDPGGTRSAARGVDPPSRAFNDIGFRCVSKVAMPPTAVASDLPVHITDTRSVNMALIPAGEFTMGSTQGDPSEEPVHNVYLDAFYMDVYEVTNALYKVCVDTGVCNAPESTDSATRNPYYGNAQYDNYPVIYITWGMAKSYCEWRGARLPTEAEWEKASRGTDGRTYPWGETLNETFANYNNAIGDTTVVGNYEKGKSIYGMYDMSGNVWELAADLFFNEYYQYSASSNPTGPGKVDEFHVVRGGSWEGSARTMRSAERGRFRDSSSDADVGFRCARSVP